MTNIELAPSVVAYARKPSVLRDVNGLANDFGASGSPFFSSSNETFWKWLMARETAPG